MNPLLDVLEDVVQLLDGSGIPYAVMGGLAVRVYGIPRPTYDIDFTVAVPRDRLLSLYSALTDLGYTIPDEYRSGWVHSVAGLPLIKFRTFVGTRGIDIDVFLAETPYQEEVISRRRLNTINGFSAWLVSPEDLILLKLISFRPRDQADIGDVRFTQGPLDESYMRHWADQLGILERLEQVLSQPAL